MEETRDDATRRVVVRGERVARNVVKPEPEHAPQLVLKRDDIFEILQIRGDWSYGRVRSKKSTRDDDRTAGWSSTEGWYPTQLAAPVRRLGRRTTLANLDAFGDAKKRDGLYVLARLGASLHAVATSGKDRGGPLEAKRVDVSRNAPDGSAGESPRATPRGHRGPLAGAQAGDVLAAWLRTRRTPLIELKARGTAADLTRSGAVAIGTAFGKGKGNFIERLDLLDRRSDLPRPVLDALLEHAKFPDAVLSTLFANAKALGAETASRAILASRPSDDVSASLRDASVALDAAARLGRSKASRPGATAVGEAVAARLDASGSLQDARLVAVGEAWQVRVAREGDDVLAKIPKRRVKLDGFKERAEPPIGEPVDVLRGAALVPGTVKGRSEDAYVISLDGDRGDAYGRSTNTAGSVNVTVPRSQIFAAFSEPHVSSDRVGAASGAGVERLYRVWLTERTRRRRGTRPRGSATTRRPGRRVGRRASANVSAAQRWSDTHRRSEPQ